VRTLAVSCFLKDRHLVHLLSIDKGMKEKKEIKA